MTTAIIMSAWGAGILSLIAYAVVNGQKKPELAPIPVKSSQQK